MLTSRVLAKGILSSFMMFMANGTPEGEGIPTATMGKSFLMRARASRTTGSKRLNTTTILALLSSNWKAISSEIRLDIHEIVTNLSSNICNKNRYMKINKVKTAKILMNEAILRL